MSKFKVQENVLFRFLRIWQKHMTFWIKVTFIKNKVQDDLNSKIEAKKDMKKKKELEKVEKLDARIKNEIKNFKTEVMELTEKLDVRIKNEIQNFKNEIEKGNEEEINDEPGTVCLLHLEIPQKVSTTSDSGFHTLMKRIQKFANN